MISIGVITRWLAPSCHAILRFSTTCPGAVHTQALVGNRRSGEIAAQLFRPLPVLDRAGTLRRGFTAWYRWLRCPLQALHFLPVRKLYTMRWLAAATCKGLPFRMLIRPPSDSKFTVGRRLKSAYARSSFRRSTSAPGASSRAPHPKW